MSKPRACRLHAIIPPRNGEGGAERRVGEKPYSAALIPAAGLFGWVVQLA